MEQLEHRDRDDPREQRDNLMDEPAHEADGAAADQQEEDEDVERGHGGSASGGLLRAPVLAAEDLVHEFTKVGEFREAEALAAFHALRHPAALEAELGRF